MENTGTVPRIGVIILNWNGRKLLETFLPSVVGDSNPAISDIIVADNGSDDDSVEYIRVNFPSVKIWEFDRNYGFAEGYNRAVAMAGAYKYVVLLNSDVAVTKGWDSTLYEFMETHPQVGAVQPKVLSYKEQGKFEYAGACGGFIDCNGYPYCRGRVFDVCEEDHGQYDDPIEIFWATGACLMVRREVYEDAGGLDAGFFAHMEEIDLCWRIHLEGWKIMAVPAATVYHLGGGSLPAENPRKTYLNFRNNLLMLHKNLPAKEGRGFLIRRRLLDTLAWAKYMLSFDFANANSILKAHHDFKKMRKAYTEHPAQNYLRVAKGRRVNLLKDFYLCGRKHWNELKGR